MSSSTDRMWPWSRSVTTTDAPFLQDAQSVLQDVDGHPQGVVAPDGRHPEPVPHKDGHVGREGRDLVKQGVLSVRSFLPHDIVVGLGVPGHPPVVESHVGGEQEAGAVAENPLSDVQRQPAPEKDGQVGAAAVEPAREVPHVPRLPHP